MLVTTIPAALARGATLVHRARVERLVASGDRIAAAEARGVAHSGAQPGPHRLRIAARHVVLASGAIGTPAVLLRSALPDPHELVGRRTFLHPTVVSAALMPDPVRGFEGAPQTIYSDHFLDSVPIDGPVGYKLEAPPLHPILAGITLPGHGAGHARLDEGFREPPGRHRAAARRLPPAFDRRARACCAPTARPSWTIRSTTSSGRACAAPTSRWPRSSSPRARAR